MRSPREPCRACGYEPLERGYRGHPGGADGSETECPRCLAQYALDDDGHIQFMYELPGRPLPSEQWKVVAPL